MTSQNNMEEKVIVFIFEISNRFEEYADSARFINSVRTQDYITSEEIQKIPLVFLANEVKGNESVEINRSNQIINSRSKEVIKPTIGELNNYISSKNKKAYHFIVSIDENMGDDIVGLQYYYLIKQMYPDLQEIKALSLLVKTPNDKSLIFKISHYLSLEIRKDKDSILFEENKKANHLPYSRVATNQINITKLKNFFPLLEINRTSFEIVSKSIDNILQSAIFIPNPNILPNISGFSIYRENQTDDSGFDLSYLLLSNTIAMLNSGHIKKELREYFFQTDFFELIRELPLLTLMLFAVSIKENKELPYDVQIAIYEAADYAEGILQLLDNMVEHSQNKKGYFSFRIHHTGVVENNEGIQQFSNNYLREVYNKFGLLFLNDYDITKKTYLINDKECKHHFINTRMGERKILPEKNEIQRSEKSTENNIKTDQLSFLELFIIDTLDISKNKIGDNKISPVFNVFHQNIKKRIKAGEDLSKYLSSIQNVQLSEFFDKSTNLSDYEADYKNITRHYGLKRFSNSVSSSRGFLQAISTYKFSGVTLKTYYRQEAQLVTSKANETELVKTIPGTKYQVLLPLNQRNYNQKFVGIDKNLKWMEKMDIFLSDKWKEIQIVLNSINKNKIERIAENGKQIIDLICKAELSNHENLTLIYVLDIFENQKNNKSLNAEYISKSLLYALSNDKVKSIPKIYFVIRNCPKYFIPEFIHNVMIAYDRYNFKKRAIMRERQIYCCSSDPFDDILIMGEDLKEMRQYMFNRSLLRGAFPSFHFLLSFIMGKQDSQINTSDSLELLNDEIPFDLILKEEDGKTIFEKRTKIILEKKINEGDLGCRIADSHIQIGSKIHLHNFYDAEILFQSSYFTTRFAALIVKDLSKKISKDSNLEYCSYKLIGYGNYSELVVSQTQKLLHQVSNQRIFGKKFSLSPYSIVNANDSTNSFNVIKNTQEITNEILPKISEKYIFIVPINSTLTTHNKLHSLFIEFLNKDDSSVLGDYALILVRDDADKKGLTPLESQFWNRIDSDSISTRLLSSPVTFFIQISGNWEDPLSCSMCFPSINYYGEYPVIETYITSIIPMLQLECPDDTDEKFELKGNKEINDIEKPLRINGLASVAKYKHIKRDDNHYLFYFYTERLINDHYEEIKKWLLEIKPEIIYPNSQCYNFLVAPLTESNTGFIELINENIFGNLAQILRFEINREYRSNFLSKFNYISKLYNNLVQTNTIWPIQSRINFYFIDDGIITGRTVERAKSLLHSLFLDISPKVPISIFEGIFVLINRLSSDSVKNHIDNLNKYYYFSNFPISSIRNSSNFCYLCKLADDSKLLSKNSSLNDLQKIWALEGEKLEPVSTENLDWNPGTDKKSKDRITYAANIAQLIRQLESNNNHLTKETIISTLLKEISQFSKIELNQEKITLKKNADTMSILESYLKLITRPFFIYKYSIRKSLLDLLILILDIFMVELENPTKKLPDDVLNIELNIINADDKFVERKEKIFSNWVRCILQESMSNKAWLFDLMIEQFSEIYSTRIFRKDFLLYIAYLNNFEWFTISENKKGTSPILAYRKAISKITNLSRDESKSIWLEYLLINGREYQDRDRTKISKSFVNIWNSINNLGIGLYLENTKVIRDALLYLSKSQTRSSCTVLDEKDYYLDNFRRLLEFNGIIYKNTQTQTWSYHNYNILQSLKEVDQFDSVNKDSLIQRQLNFDSPNSNEILSNDDSNVNTEDHNKENGEISYSDIVSSMINLQQFLNQRNQIATGDNKETLLSDFDFICESINNISLGIFTDIILVPPEKNFTDEDKIVIFTRAINRNWINLLKKPIYLKENFEENNFIFETYNIDKNNRRIIIKIIDGIENQRIFISINFSPQSKKSVITGMEYAFTIRNILLFRGQIKELIEKHINGNSLQSWVMANQKENLLENIKHIRHTDFESSIFENCVNQLIVPKSDKTNDYIFSMQATVLKLMADINISSIYHSTIVSPDDDFNDVENNKTHWNAQDTLSSLFNPDVINALIPLTTNGKRFIRWNIPNISQIGNYYLRKSSEGLLILVSFIENAIKFSPENGNIELSICPFNISSKLYNFCISNDLTDSYKDEQDLKSLEEQVKECLLYPVEERWNGINIKSETQSAIGGVSLFAANHYCERLLISLGIPKARKISIIEYVVSKNKSNNRNQITFRIPILYKVGEEAL
jgi:hypothetical protein